MVRILLIILLGLFWLPVATAAPNAFSYQGQIIKPDGQALEGSSVTFTIEILSPGAESCLLYEETHTINMANSNGIFSLEVGAGNRSGSDYEDTNSLANTFDNTAGLITPTYCDSVGSYTPVLTDSRKLRITFDDGSGPVTLAQNHNLVSVPFATSASSIDGLNSADLLQINTGGANELSQANLETVFTTTNRAELMALLGGTSSQYVQAGGSVDVDVNSNKIVNLADPTSANDAANKNYVDANIGGRNVDGATIGTIGVGQAGQVLTWNGTQWTSSAPSGDSTKLPLDGSSSMSGNLNLGTNDITNANDITLTNDLTVGNNVSITGGIGVGTGINSAGTITAEDQNIIRFGDSDSSVSGGYVGFIAPSTVASDVTWTLPDADGSAGQILSTNGSGTLSWVNDSSPVTSVFSRTGAITAQTSDYDAVQIDNTAAGNIVATNVQAAIDELDTEKIAKAGDTMTGDLVLSNESDVRFGDSVGGEYAAIQAPNDLAANYTLTLPADDGAAGEILQTDGSGVLSWTTAASGTITGGTNVGISGEGPFKQVNGANLEFKNISAGSTKVTVTDDAGNDEIDIDIVEANIDHDSLSGFVANEHIDHSGVNINTTANSGLSGGGNITASRSLAVDVNNATAETVINDADSLLIYDASATGTRKITRSNFLTGYLEAAIGTAAGDVMGADAVPNCTASQKLQMSVGPVFSWSCVADLDTDDHGALAGLTDDDHTQYALLAGRVGGQTLNGGTGASDDLTIDSTSNVTKGNILLNPTGGSIGVGTTNPTEIVHLRSDDPNLLLTDSSSSRTLKVGIVSNIPAIEGDPTTRLVLNPTSGEAIVLGSLNVNAQGHSRLNVVGVGDNTNYAAVSSSDSAMGDVLLINGSGNIGVGTTTPDTILEIAGSLKIADGAETCTVGTDGGMIRYNGTDLQYCNGTAWQTLGISGAGLTSLGGQTGSTQTFAAGSVGNAPAISSAGNTHTLNVPLASAGGTVTSGTISNADYVSFSNKLDAVAGETLADSQVWVGNGSNQAAAVAISGDATIANTGALTIANNAVTTAKINNNAITSAKINDGEIVDADISASAAIARSKIASGTANRVLITDGSGVMTDAAAITANRALASDANGIPVATLVTDSELGYLDGVTSAIQTQLDGKQASLGYTPVDAAGDTMTGDLVLSNESDVRFGDSVGGQYAAIQAPNDLAANYTLTLPADDGTSGQVLQTDGSGVLTWANQSSGADDLGNHTATANIQLNGNWLSNDGGNEGISIDNSGNVGIGTTIPDTILEIAGTLKLADGAETCTVGTDGGMIRYNGTDLQYCNGSAWQTLGISGAGLTSLGGQTGSTQTFAAGSAGNAPAISSAGNTHTLNVPLASAGGTVTSGTISNADYVSFSNKLDAVAGETLADSQVWVGNASNQAAAVAISGDATIANTGALTIANSAVTTAKINNNAITSAKINDGEIVDADISASAAIARSKIASGTANRVLITDGSGVMTDAAAITANRALASDANGIPVATLVTDTELGYLDGVTSAIQTQLDGKQASLGYTPVDVAGDTMTGDLLLSNESDVRFGDSVGGQYAAIQAPNDLAANYTLTLPADDGTSGQVLQTDGSGALSWVAQSSGADDLGNHTATATLNLNNNLISNVNIGDATGPSISFNGDSNTGIFSPAADSLSISTAGSEAMTINSTGDIGIGTTTPDTILEIAGTLKLADGAETCTVGTDGGMIRYNGTDLQYCNGSAWQTLGISGAGLTSLGGQTGSTQTFAAGSAGNAPAISSAGNTHTLNVPLASAGGTVTSGTISNADYVSFSNKLDAVAGETLADSQVWVGNASNQAAAVAISGDATIANTGALTIANSAVTTAKINNNAITSAKINDGEIVDADISASAAIARSKIASGTANRVLITDGSGVMTDAAAITANRALASDANGIPVATLVTNTELGYLDGVTSAIQTQLDGKQASLGYTPVDAAGDTMIGDLLLSNESDVRFGDSVGGQYAAIQAPNDLAANYTLTLPADDGTSGQVLQTDGSGALSWVAQSSGADDLGNHTATANIQLNGNWLSNDGGNEGISIDNSGNVGIGTATPARRLHIEAPGGNNSSVVITRSDNTNDASRIDFWPSGVNSPTNVSWNVGLEANSNDFRIANWDGSSLKNPLVLTNSGNVGIGTTTPDTILEIAGSLKIADGAETCTVGTDGGMIRYNGTDLQYCNGTAWQTLGISGAGLTSLGGQTGSTQTFAAGSAGNAPAISSAGNTHTLNVPLASAGGTVTSGTISNADYVSFSNKLDAVAGETLADSQVWVGNASNQAAAVAISGDATIANTGALTIANNAVTTAKINNNAITSAKINDGEIVDADISASAAIARSKIASGTANRVLITDGSGVMTDAAAITANRALASDANGIPVATLVTDTELGYLDGVTSAIQTQLDGKQASLGYTPVDVAGDTMTGDLLLSNESDVRFGDSVGGQYAAIQAPNDLAANYTLTLPADDGTSGQVLQTDGSGALSWVAQSSGSDDLGNHTATATLNLNNNLISNVNIGDATSPSISFNGDSNTGIFSPAGDSLAFSTAGNEAMAINSSGHVGIGTTAPTSELHVTSQDNGVTAVRIEETTGTDSVWELRSYDPTFGAGYSNSFAIFGGTPAGGLQDRLVINNGGGVGIGTNSPDTLLEIAGSLKLADGSETCSVGADGGMIRYNGTDLQYCNGSAWQTLGVSGAGLTSLGGQTGSTQTFAAGSAGNAPAISSAGNTHTLNVPLASAGGTVTSGTISNADYVSFSNKLDAVAGETLADSQVWVGNASNQAAAVAISGDATLSNAGALTIAGNAITSAKINDGEIVNADISASAAIARSKIASGTANRVLITDGSGVMTDAAAITANRALASDANGIPVATLVTNTELGYLDGVTSAIQTQLDGKQASLGYTPVDAAGDTMTGDLLLSNESDVRFGDSVGGQYAAIQAPNDLAANYTLTLPADDGTSGQILQTDGSGVLSWASAGGGGDFQSDGSVTMTGTFKAANGTAALPSVTFGSDTNTGIYREGVDLLGFSTNGLKTLSIDASSNYAFHSTAGALTFNLDASAREFEIFNGGVLRSRLNGVGELSLRDSSATERAKLDATGELTLTDSGGVKRVNLTTSGGNITLKDSSNVTTIQMDASANTFVMDDNSGQERITLDGGSGYILLDNSSNAEVVRIASESGDTFFNYGNVGIGTNSPEARLDVEGRIISGDKGSAAGDGGSIIFEELSTSTDDVVDGVPEHVGFRAPDSVSADIVWQLPGADGSAGQVLRTDGSGVLSWVNQSSGISSLGGQTGSTQTFAAGSAGNAPAISSSGDTHTLNVPLASAGGTVTSGTISNADYVSFSNKLDAVAGETLADSQVWVGNGSNVAAAVAISGDATLSNAGALTIAGNAITSAKINDGEIVNADISASAAIARSKIASGTANRVLITDGSGVMTDAAAITANRALASDANGIPVATLVTNTELGYLDGVTSAIQTQLDGKQASLGYTPVDAAGDTMTGDLLLSNESDVRFGDSVGGQYAAIQAPNDLAANYTLTLPSDDGTSGQVLQTDGSGVLSWVAQGSGADDLGDHTATTTLNLNNNLISNVNIGNATSPSISFNGDSNTGIFSPAGDSLAFSTAGNEAMAINSSGNVGVGTTAPDTALHAYSTSAAVLRVESSQSDAEIILEGSGTGATKTGIGANGSDLIFYSGGSESGRFNSFGDLTLSRDLSVRVIEAEPVGGLSGNGGRIQLKELSGNGSNYIGFRAPDSLAADLLWELPAVDGSAGQVLQTNGSGVLSWTAAGGSGDFMADGSVAMTGAVKAANGNAASPSITFNSDLDTGLHYVSDGNFGMSFNGTQRIQFNQTGLHYLGTGGFLLGAGTGAAGPAYSFYSDDNTGMYRPIADTIAFSNNGSESLRLDASGNVGIGTTVPGDLLHVYKSSGSLDATFETTSGSGAVDVELVTNGRKAGIRMHGNTHATYPEVMHIGTMSGTSTNGELGLMTGDGTEQVRIDSSGNVGIGTTTPSGKLDIEGGDVYIGTGTLTNGTAGDDLSVSGNVEVDGIIYGDGSGLTGITASSASGGSNTGNFVINADSDSSAGGDIDFQIGGSSKATIQNDGDFAVDTNTLFVDAVNNEVGIGTADPDAVLEVYANPWSVLSGYHYTNNMETHANNGSNSTATIVTSKRQMLVDLAGDKNNLYTDQVIMGMGGSGNVDEAVGVKVEVNGYPFTGTANNVTGVESTIRLDAAGTYTNSYLFYGGTPSITTGTATNVYGLYLGDMLGTNQYGIYQTGSNDTNYFAGQVGIGTSSPNATAALHIAADGDTTNMIILDDIAGGGQDDISITNDGVNFNIDNLTDSVNLLKFNVNSGNAAMGTDDTTGQNLHIHTTDSAGSDMRFTNLTTGEGETDGLELGIDSAEAAFIENHENTDLIVSTNSTEAMRITASGDVGIGSSSPRVKLDINGAVAGAPAVAEAAGTIDFSASNFAYTAASCGAFNLHHMKDGATYTMAVQGTTAATCSFSAYSDAGTTALTMKLPPSHGATTAGKETLYSFVVIGTTVYASWIPGY